MSNIKIPEYRGWAIYTQNSHTNEYGIPVHFGVRMIQAEENTARTLAYEGQQVEEVIIRPVSLGFDPVQWAAVQLMMSLLNMLCLLQHHEDHDESNAFVLWHREHRNIFGGSLERDVP